jgi:hypothetical protein
MGMLGTLWSDILLALEVRVISTVFGMVRSMFVISPYGKYCIRYGKVHVCN